jgi:hypothetical protein
MPRCALLWAPIPIISWVVPAIGHMGIATSTGACVDFAGPYFVAEDASGCTIFGSPTRSGDRRMRAALQSSVIADTWLRPPSTTPQALALMCHATWPSLS